VGAILFPTAARIMWRFLLGILVLTSTASSAAAWSATAHEIICEIAWRRFSPPAKRLVMKLRRADKQAGRTFASSCAWADRVRRPGGSHPRSGPWHYINVPPGSTGVDPKRDCPSPRLCVTWAIDHFVERLADASLSARERAEALKFVAHFVGDVHQPLHVGRADDRGGNTIAVDFLGDFGSCKPGSERNLHEIWDRHLLTRAKFRWPTTANELDAALDPEQVRAWKTTDVVGWANESYQLSERFVYQLPPPVERCGAQKFHPITAAYADEATQIIRQRLQQAGVRLAHLIDKAARGEIRRR